MAPRRSARRATASPSPAPVTRASTPGSARGGAHRATPLPAKYSTSYGSPLSQLPDRGAVGGGGGVTKAAAEIFTKVTKDNLAAEARRRTKEQTRAARAARAGSRGSTASPEPPTIHPTIEEELPEPEGATSGEDLPEAPVARSLGTTARKRARDDDDEAEARAEKERKERDARLRRERSEEARIRREQKLAEAQAAAEAAAQEKQRLAEQAARDEATRAAMPPPPHQPVPRPPAMSMLTPASATLPNGVGDRPASARSYVEEGGVFVDATIQTPTRPPLEEMRQLGQPRPQPPPFKSTAEAPMAAPSEQTPPPSVLRKSPRRPTKIPPHPEELPPSPKQQRQQPEPVEKEKPGHVDKDRPRHKSRAGLAVTSALSPQLSGRLKPLPRAKHLDLGYGSRLVRETPTEVEETPTEVYIDDRSYRDSLVRLLNPWSVLKILAGGFLMLHLIRFAHILARPDVFESPVLSLNWYGWRDWTSNVGQFFPSPLLHPLGVLTSDQYNDLKSYLDQRTTSTEAALDNLRDIIPKVVSVQKDKRTGKIAVSDEFWLALRDRLHRDQSILTVDDKNRISEKHWNALQNRLKSVGLTGKTLSASDVEDMIKRLAPQAWEKWVQNNERKVADILGRAQGKHQDKGRSSAKTDDEVVVTREEFMRELNEHLAKSQKQFDKEMESHRLEIEKLIRQVKEAASATGMAKKEITSLVQRTVNKAIGELQLKIASKTGAASIVAALGRQVNHFGPGNGAAIDLSLTSPTYQIINKPPIGSKKWLKSMRNMPQFQHERIHALTPWVDAGHCWCAGIRAANGSTIPADVAVRLARVVIPQYIVLEHIDPAATNDPLARPKDIEVWAAFDEPARRERVLDWMAAKFPEIEPGHRWVAQGLAKIGAFRYKYKDQDAGIYIHKLSDELLKMDAATDLVAVRAITNYGAEDHTCFYRIRMYGNAADSEGETES
ncbi:hypothetical protein MFIFM68171_06784 [Madurella fahalii]|uniref:SUN domain-containing protein n=1 Tax=Madurella fahalii TaxID=1157608 RepID=A0ABQ0GFX1_9PEZI